MNAPDDDGTLVSDSRPDNDSVPACNSRPDGDGKSDNGGIFVGDGTSNNDGTSDNDGALDNDGASDDDGRLDNDGRDFDVAINSDGKLFLLHSYTLSHIYLQIRMNFLFQTNQWHRRHAIAQNTMLYTRLSIALLAIQDIRVDVARHAA